MKNVLICTVACLVSAASNASTIIQYNTAGSTTSLAPFFEASDITGDNLTAGAGISVQNFSTFNFTDWDTDNLSYADAVADDEIWQWGFTVDSGLGYEVETMDIRLDRSGTGPDDFEIKASVNAGPEVSLLTYDFMDSSSGVNFLGVDISAIGTVVPGDSVVFTLAAFNSESTAGSFDLETITFPGGNDSIVISGTQIVPEPSSILMLIMSASAAGAVVMRRRLG